MTTIDKITESVIKEYGDRKTKGRIDFVIDVNTGKIYPVPRDLEHKDFTKSINGNEYFIPIQLRFDKENRVKEVITGASSFEEEYQVRHFMKDLVKAHNSAWDLILRSGLDLCIERNEILKIYSKN